MISLIKFRFEVYFIFSRVYGSLEVISHCKSIVPVEISYLESSLSTLRLYQVLLKHVVLFQEVLLACLVRANYWCLVFTV